MLKYIENTWLWDCINLLYPETCCACGKHLHKQEDILCLFCELELPFSNYHLDPENNAAKQLWGRVQLEQMAAMFLFTKGGKVQRLVHQLKYKGREDVGERLGEMYGKTLTDSAEFQGVDCIVPVPLHPEKERRRGYNQSAAFGQGLSKGMGVEFRTDVLFRKVFTDTQTRKTREDRWSNVAEVFGLLDADSIQGQHILLVDDVLTTGATLEATARVLLAVEGVKVSGVCMASAV